MREKGKSRERVLWQDFLSQSDDTTILLMISENFVILYLTGTINGTLSILHLRTQLLRRIRFVHID